MTNEELEIRLGVLEDIFIFQLALLVVSNPDREEEFLAEIERASLYTDPAVRDAAERILQSLRKRISVVRGEDRSGN